MTFHGVEHYIRARKPAVLQIAFAAAILLLSGCTTINPDAGTTAAEVPATETSDSTSTIANAEPTVDAASCPEPEPVEPLVCPPAPTPKPCPVCPINKIDGKLLVGAVEYVKLSPPGVIYQARIDSGAEGTSIHASNIVRFERDGDKWVKFDLDSKDGKAITLERQVLRVIRVRQSDRQESDKRLVVMMTMTLGTLTEQVEISLNDRSDMDQPVLIGRNFLHNNAIVDVSQKFIAK